MVDTEDLWKFYFHDPNDNNWLHESYRLVTQISSANELNGIHHSLKDVVHNGMFFLMREHVFPAWDDPCNISGGCVCLKIQKTMVEKFWHAVCANLLGETLVKEAYRDTECVVNGVSISPKNFFCIVKIWLSNDKLSRFGADCFEFSDFDGQTLYKPNDQESQKFATDRASVPVATHRTAPSHM
eukprot:jgi/Tetstr1/447251/TSEL_034688.t1